MIKHPVVIIESPFKANEQYTEKDNLEFAQWLCRDMALRGFNPFASHVYYTRFLKDATTNERHVGMVMGLQAATALDPVLVTFNVRQGEHHMSDGMEQADEYWAAQGIPCQFIKWEQKTVVPVHGSSHSPNIYVPISITMMMV